MTDTCQTGTCTSGTAVTCGTCETCTPSGGCIDEPATGCFFGPGSITLKDSPVDAKDSVAWKMGAIGVGFGDPQNTTDYDFCTYDTTAGIPSLRLALSIPHGGPCGTKPCWTAKASGFKYADKTLASNGVSQLSLAKVGTSIAHLALKAKGVNVPMPTLPLSEDSFVLVQLRRRDSPICWSTTFTSFLTQKNDAAQFRAKN
jgi:hypothetical protein